MSIKPLQQKEQPRLSLPELLLALTILILLAGTSPSLADKTHHDSIDHQPNPQTTPLAAKTSLLLDADYFARLIKHLEQAKERIDVAMFLFKTTDSPQNRPLQIVTALRKAKARGAKVHVLLEISNHDQELNRENQKTAELLRQGGVTVVFDQPKTTTHAKLVVIDKRYVFMGSHNFTHAALTYNHESSLLIDNPQLAAELSRYITTLAK